MPAGLDGWLARAPVDVLEAHVTAQGTSRPLRMRIEVAPAGREPLVLRVKWKPVPQSGDASNNTPRREIAAYELQKLFSAPDEYVVPPIVLRCLPRTEYVEGMGERTPFPGTDCLLGAMSYWLENVEEMNGIDAERLRRDAEYRGNMSLLNLFTILAAQRDSAGLNFLESTDADRPRVFSVDNSMTFGAFRHNPLSWFSDDWLEVQVPALSRAHVDRLRELTRADLDALAVVSELAQRDGMLVPVKRHSPPIDADAGVRRRGGGLQLGLTRAEIDEIDERRRSLLESVDRGEIAVY